MAFNRRKDLNHKAVAAELIARGYDVSDISAAGDGLPDLVVSRGLDMRLVEIKRPDRAHLRIHRESAEGKSRARQAAFAARHPGLVLRVTSADEVEGQWPK